MVKNFLPALWMSLFCWLALGLLVYLTAPVSILHLVIFYFLFFMALFLTLSLVLANSRRGLLITIGIVGFLLLRQLKISNFLNLILLIGILISLEVYLRKR